MASIMRCVLQACTSEQNPVAAKHKRAASTPDGQAVVEHLRAWHAPGGVEEPGHAAREGKQGLRGVIHRRPQRARGRHDPADSAEEPPEDEQEMRGHVRHHPAARELPLKEPTPLGSEYLTYVGMGGKMQRLAEDASR